MILGVSRKRIFIVGEMLLKSTVIIDFMCLSVNCNGIFVYFFLRDKVVHITCCRAIILNPNDMKQ